MARSASGGTTRTKTPRGVVITGAAQGLGKAMAQRFAADGHVVIGVDRSGDLLRAAQKKLGAQHHAIEGDAGDPACIAAACQLAAKEAGGVHALVLNAGVTSGGPSGSFSLEEWDRIVAVNLRAVFVGAQAASPFLKKGSSIVMLSSIAASFGLPDRAAYCASKSGVDGLLRALAVEWAARGVRVNAVAPGSFMTDMVRELVKSGKANIDRYMSRTPMGRMGDPSELANAVAFLASPQASYITGVVLPVDGGWAAAGLTAMT